MKITLKTLVYSAIFLFIASEAKAQLSVPDSLRISVGGELMATTGTSFGTGVNTVSDGQSSSAYNYGAGVSLKVDVPVLSSLFATASVGYNSYFTTGNAANSQQALTNVPAKNFNTIPIKLGLKVFIGGDRFYAHGEVGETLLANKKEMYAIYGNSFTWSPGIGLIFPLAKRHTYIDAGIRYETTATFYNNNNTNSFWGLHLAYAFNLK